jgi:hypothetical protein
VIRGAVWGMDKDVSIDQHSVAYLVHWSGSIHMISMEF